MKTTRLHYDDPWLLGFDATVVAHGVFGGKPSVLLDRTAFYPESGGQMADRGVLAGQPVTDVQVDDEGAVFHAVDGPLPPVGAVVTGSIDRARRRLFMALHTGQHMLSRALVDVAGLETVSSRLGETTCTIDVDGGGTEAQVAAAESLTNGIIDDDVPVRAWFPEAEELRTLPLRRQPKVTENVRVVEVAGFDVSPCGGTHCLRSAEVGLVVVTGLEKYKGKLRVTFSAGKRARDELGAERARLVGLAKELSCGTPDVGSALEKLRRELTEAREMAGRLRSRLASAEADELLASVTDSGSGLVTGILEDAPIEHVRVVASRITARPGFVAILAGRGPDGLALVAARGEGSAFDCGALVKALAAKTGGRGGGRPERAEGRLPAGVDLAALVAELAPG